MSTSSLRAGHVGLFAPNVKVNRGYGEADAYAHPATRLAHGHA
ncbi:MAG: hypothetical protein ACRCXM_04610 [Beijerinckiaceae bacterium]